MKFAFVINATISMSTEVEAATLEEAIEMAQSRDVQRLCWSCAKGKDDAWSTGGELDCEPCGSELVDLHTDGGETFERAVTLWEKEKP